MEKLRLTRNQAGSYTAIYQGFKVEFTNMKHFGGDRDCWHVIVNGHCNDAHATLADAKYGFLMTVKHGGY